MEKKTISNLNSKAWYRLLKVLFSLTLLLVLAFYNTLVFANGVTNVDQNRTIISCNLRSSWEEKPTFSPASINIAFSNSDFNDGKFNYNNYFESFNDFAIGAITKKCYPKMTDDIYSEQKEAEIINSLDFIRDGVVASSTPQAMSTYNTEYNTYKSNTNGLIGNEKTRYLDFSYQLFSVAPVFTDRSFLEFFFIGNFIILLVFEAVRRCFYYIVLGSIKPESK